MRRRSVLIAFVALALASPLASAQTIRIRLANAANPPHPHVKAGEMWKALVEKKTGGKVEVQFFHSRQLGDDRQNLESTVAGTIDASLASTILIPLVVKKQSFDALQLPFLISSYDNLAKVFLSPAAQALLDDLDSAGLKGLSFAEGGLRHYLSARGQVAKLPDLKGLKTRIVPVPLHKAIWDATGASPIGMAYGEVYTSLQTKVIDAVEINVSSVVSENLWEPAKHFTMTGHYFWPAVLIYNKAKFDKLPADIQKAMIEAGREIIMPQVMGAKADEAQQVEQLKKRGVRFYEFADLPQMRGQMKPILDQWAAKDKNIAAFIAEVNKIEGR